MKQKRIPCPHCKEMIIADATKCRFCSENLTITEPKRAKGLNSLGALYWMWVLTVIIFFALVMSVGKSTTEPSNLWWFFWWTDSFFVLLSFIRILKEYGQSNQKVYKRAFILTLIGLIIFLMNYHTLELKLGFVPLDQPEKSEIQGSVASPTPSSTPKATPVSAKTISKPSSGQITCTGPDGKSFNTTQAKCDEFNTAWGNAPTPNPNETIQCNVHVNCGGGTKEMTRASCDQSTCCSLSSGNAITSKDDCKNKQYNECVEKGQSAGLSLYYSMEACSKYK